jgi:molybdopterin synthase catalytic subunit
MEPPAAAEDWVGLSGETLPLHRATGWVVLPGCGAVVAFSGTTRDHSGARQGVLTLHYEAYEEQAAPALGAVVAEIRRRWPTVGRVVLLHRTGEVPVTDTAVVVVVSAPHREEAFEAARYGIDALKATVPIWKKEVWDGGESWGLDAQHLVTPDAVSAADRPPPGGRPAR